MSGALPAPRPWRARLGRPGRAAAVLLLFAALTAVLAFPLSLEPGRRALPLSADTRLFLWTLAWDVRALTRAPLSAFDANIFYPEPRSLAFSEHLLGSAALAAPWLLASGNPLLALNAVMLLSCVLSGAGAYWLCRQLGLGTGGALVAGMVFAFAPPRFSRLAQAHLAAVQWIPFCLAALHAYARSHARAWLWAAAAFFTLQATASGHGGLFLLLAAAGLLAYLAAMGRLPPPSRLAADALPVGLALIAANLPFLLPYFAVQRTVGLRRTLGAVYDWAPDAASFLAAPTHLQQALVGLWPALAAQVAGARAYLFPGWIALALAVAALRRAPAAAVPDAEPPPAASRPVPAAVWAADVVLALLALAALAVVVAGGIDVTVAGVRVTARTPRRALAILGAAAGLRLALAPRAGPALLPALRRALRRYRRWSAERVGVEAGFYVLLGALSLWAALGPGFGLYTALYRLVPGFDLIRVPSRLTTLTLLALAVLAGAGFDRWLRRHGPRGRGLLTAAAVAALAAESAAFPLKAPLYPLDVPAVDAWLAGQPAGAVVELPVADPADAAASARLHSHYMLHSMAHWRPLVNGYSGIIPPRHEALFRLLAGFPDDVSLAALERLGVRYAVVHLDFYPRADRPALERRLAAAAGRLRLLHAEAEGRVYALSATSP